MYVSSLLVSPLARYWSKTFGAINHVCGGISVRRCQTLVEYSSHVDRGLAKRWVTRHWLIWVLFSTFRVLFFLALSFWFGCPWWIDLMRGATRRFQSRNLPYQCECPCYNFTLPSTQSNIKPTPAYQHLKSKPSKEQSKVKKTPTLLLHTTPYSANPRKPPPHFPPQQVTIKASPASFTPPSHSHPFSSPFPIKPSARVPIH